MRVLALNVSWVKRKAKTGIFTRGALLRTERGLGCSISNWLSKKSLTSAKIGSTSSVSSINSMVRTPTVLVWSTLGLCPEILNTLLLQVLLTELLRGEIFFPNLKN